MIISVKQMQKIAEEVGSAIQKDINIMDETGRIIASTDRKRIGMLHAGAEELLDKNLEEFIIEKGYKGAYRGINLPLVIENKVIGVVGITGRVEEVRMLGGAIKKMTEMMILDRYKNSQKQAIEEFRRGYLLNLLFGEDENRAELGSEMLKIDISNPRIVSVFEIDSRIENEEDDWQELLESVIFKIKKEVERDKQQMALGMGSKVIAIYNTDSIETALNLSSAILESSKISEKCRISCGIGRPRKGKTGIQRSYKEAEIVCSMVKSNRETHIRVYNETDLSQLLLGIPYKKRESFVDEIFHNCDENQKQEIIQCLKSYIKNNGSISKVSEELYVHKNTLQYRLTKMKTLTGYDPRILKEAIPLAIAVCLEKYL